MRITSNLECRNVAPRLVSSTCTPYSKMPKSGICISWLWSVLDTNIQLPSYYLCFKVCVFAQNGENNVDLGGRAAGALHPSPDNELVIRTNVRRKSTYHLYNCFLVMVHAKNISHLTQKQLFPGYCLLYEQHSENMTSICFCVANFACTQLVSILFLPFLDFSQRSLAIYRDAACCLGKLSLVLLWARTQKLVSNISMNSIEY